MAARKVLRVRINTLNGLTHIADDYFFEFDTGKVESVRQNRWHYMTGDSSDGGQTRYKFRVMADKERKHGKEVRVRRGDILRALHGVL